MRSGVKVAVGHFDPKLRRVRTHADDFYDHRALALKAIQVAMSAEKVRKSAK